MLDEIQSAVAAFNVSSPLGQIQFAGRGIRNELILPFGGPLRIKFFDVQPELKLKRGIVNYAARVTDSDQAGLNFLLCRTDNDDLYDRWVPCESVTRLSWTPGNCRRVRNRSGSSRGDEGDRPSRGRDAHLHARLAASVLR
jgi:hypothetical protein